MGLEYPDNLIHANNQIAQNQNVLVDNSYAVNNFVHHIYSYNFAQPEDILPPISQLILKLKRENNYYLKHEDN
jgi:hypothetical protein